VDTTSNHHSNEFNRVLHHKGGMLYPRQFHRSSSEERWIYPIRQFPNGTSPQGGGEWQGQNKQLQAGSQDVGLEGICWTHIESRSTERLLELHRKDDKSMNKEQKRDEMMDDSFCSRLLRHPRKGVIQFSVLAGFCQTWARHRHGYFH